MKGWFYQFGIHKGNNKAVLRVTLNSTAFNLQWVPFKELYIRSNHGKIFGFMFLPVRESERHYSVGRIQPTHIEQALVPHFSKDTVLVADSHRAYKTVANKHKIPLKQIPSGKHTSGGYSLGHINGYHHNISDFMYLYHGVSSKFLDYYLALFYWIEKNKDKSYLDQAYDIITLLSNQTKKIPLAKFKDKPISFDLKGLLG